MKTPVVNRRITSPLRQGLHEEYNLHSSRNFLKGRNAHNCAKTKNSHKRFFQKLLKDFALTLLKLAFHQHFKQRTKGYCMSNIQEEQKDDSAFSECKLTANVKAGGCAAKLSSHELAEIVFGIPKLDCPQLLSGIDNFEDASVYKISDDLAVIQSVDFFPPLVDDPFLFGKIAAVNALSDIYAMGGKPVMALNILSFPSCDLPLAAAKEILKGGAEIISQSGAVLAGGHSIQGKEALYGLSVTGLVHPEKILTNSKACLHDQIILCKPIGTGVGLLALKGGVLSNQTRNVLVENLIQLNDQVLNIAHKYKVNAATDITGFGLIGHLHEMASASKLKARLFPKAVPVLPEVAHFVEQGFVPGAAYANRTSYEKFVHGMYNDPFIDLLFDPQTAGGLMFSMEKDQAATLVSDLKAANLVAQVIGEFVSGKAGLVELVNHES